MELLSPWNMRVSSVTSFPYYKDKLSSYSSSLSNSSFTIPFLKYPFHSISKKFYCTVHAKKGKSQNEPVLKQTTIQEVARDNDDEEEGQLMLDEFDDDDEGLIDDGDDEDFDDEFLLEEDEAELYAGDGAGGGGISLAGTWWDKEVLKLAEEVCNSFEGELQIYAFKTLLNSTVQVRIERLTNKSGSPSMEDVEAFSTTYRRWLDEAELAKTIPDNISLEVSSPGVERVVRIPQDLDRFKERNMYVKYVDRISGMDSSSESDGIFTLISFDTETQCCTWGLANVRVNREKAGKGRPLNKKQREWRLNTSFDSLRLVRVYSEA